MTPNLHCTLAALGGLLVLSASAAEPKPLFDGRSLNGWEGDAKVWSVKDGEIVGGSLEKTVPQNEFLASTRSYTNFVLRLKFRLEGTEGFVNSGMQIRSQRIPNHNEMIGYQADLGDGWWGALYDESRRNKVLSKPADADLGKPVRKNDWNDYEIRCEGPRIQLRINGVSTVDYTETQKDIPLHGRIGLQVHGGGRTKVSFKDILIEELP
jgi:hypothetical protein